ncbi:hypothetical protein [Christiangramia echinicola]|uniref:Uncharacterized protein n=1 Tax=Christiangramia echinicola TaxID=279359 RepID=A0A1H1MEV0_9FLAO|nr:hypothetical protein [Christiangramia echinicola]SDR85122.1 hypothetical protein SAMN04488552_1269 [Christiangramia echinicola]
MDKRAILLFLIPTLFFHIMSSQDNHENFPVSLSELFLDEEIMNISLSYSNKDMKKDTNDSTYIHTYLKFEVDELQWDSLEVRLRKRGNFRLKNCSYAPLKVKIKKKEANKTPFEGHKNLKLVLPCLIQRDMNDNVLKEYLAYKLYEVISPYHFKTKLVELNYEELRGNKIKLHEIKAFFIEDDKHVAERIGGKVLKSNIHPLNHMARESVRNSFFQFMIGNTDFSNAYQHNSKLIFREGEIIPVPYDFDMAGIVNTSYATVSQINNEMLSIDKVTQRMYRGFQREPKLFHEVRLEFLNHRPALLKVIQDCELLFEDDKEYFSMLLFIEGFFEILMNEEKFENEILAMARRK